MSNPAPSPSWMQLQVHLLQYIVPYLEGHHGVSTVSQVPALPIAPGVLPWGCRVQGQGWGGMSLDLPSPAPSAP